jgi:hypothetical protein
MQDKHEKTNRRADLERAHEIVRAVLLAVVAVASAWSVYQSTRWTAAQSTLYAQASALRVQAGTDATEAGQLRLYDLVLTNNWLNAYASGDTQLQDLYERRFRPEFRPTFDAWLALDPFHNPDAPPGPLFMPEYQVGLSSTADSLNAQASQIFEQGQAASTQAGAYILNTVYLATVLFLITIEQRFEWHVLRTAILGVALAMLLFGLYHLLTYPVIV